MRKTLLYLLCLLSIQCIGQTIIRGTVIQLGSDNPVIGATVYNANEKSGTITNAEGKFVLECKSGEELHLHISSVGFQDLEYTVDQSTDQLLIHLEEKIFDLPGVLIESATLTGGLSSRERTLGSAHFISQKEIQRFSYTDINRTLRTIPGVNIQEEDGFGLRPNIGLRAAGSERSSKITVMEDGILAAPAPYAAPAAYYFPTVGRMHAIEILKGSSQIKFGPYTTGGAINLISSPIPDKFSGHADFITGSYGYKMLHANLGNSHKNISYLVETMQYSADGFKQLPDNASTGFNKEDFMAKIKINTNPGASVYQSLMLKIAQAGEISNETYLGLTREDFRINPLQRYAGSRKDQMDTEHRQISLTHSIQINDKLDLYTRAYRNDFDRNWYKLDKLGGKSISSLLELKDAQDPALRVVRGESDAESGLLVKANNRTYYSRGLQSNLFWHHTGRTTKQSLDIGLRVHYDQMDRFQWVDDYGMESGTMKLIHAGQPGTESNRIESAHALAAHVQYKLELKDFTVSPGLRFEDIRVNRMDYGKTDPARTANNLTTSTNEVQILIPGLGFSYTLDESGQFFGGIHKGFAPPGSREGTRAEESWNYELGYRITTSGFRIQILSYLNNYSNLLGSDLAASGGTGSTDMFNGGKAIARGLEFELSTELIRNPNRSIALPLRFSYTYSDSRFKSSFASEFEGWGDVSDGDHLPYVPKNQIGMNLGIEHEKFLFDISGKYAGSMLTRAGNFGENENQTESAFTMDLALNYRLSKELSLFVNANNVLDRVYIIAANPAGVRPSMPRAINLGLKANF